MTYPLEMCAFSNMSIYAFNMSKSKEFICVYVVRPYLHKCCQPTRIPCSRILRHISHSHSHYSGSIVDDMLKIIASSV